MPLRALLLDFDGTLADSLPALRRVYERFVTDAGGTPTTAEFDALNGPPLREVVDSLCRAHQGRGGTAEDLEHYHRLIDEELVRIEPSPGARRLIDAARSRGLALAIVTSGRSALVRRWLEAAGLQVDLIVCGDEVAEGKPSPTPYRLALQKLGIGRDEALAIEDSRAGVRSATAAGVRTLRLGSDGNPGAEAACVASLDDVLSYLGGQTWAP